MGYTVSVNHPHFPEETEFSVSGLGIIPNGSSTDVDEESERLFILQHGMSVEDGFANDAVVSASGSSALDSTEVDDLIAASGVEVWVPEEEAPVNEDATQSTTPQDPGVPTSSGTGSSGSGSETDDAATSGTSGGGI